MITESEAKRIILSDYGIETKAYLIHLTSREEKVVIHPECGTDCTEHYMGLEIYFCSKCKVEF